MLCLNTAGVTAGGVAAAAAAAVSAGPVEVPPASAGPGSRVVKRRPAVAMGPAPAGPLAAPAVGGREEEGWLGLALEGAGAAAGGESGSDLLREEEGLVEAQGEVRRMLRV